jgi:hypothetical protein
MDGFKLISVAESVVFGVPSDHIRERKYACVVAGREESEAIETSECCFIGTYKKLSS